MDSTLLRSIVRALEDGHVAYMVTGSFASTYHSAPRTTRNIDVVIAAEVRAIEVLEQAFADDRFYVGNARRALDARSMFNVIDGESGWKADLIFQKDRAFSATELARRVPATIAGVDTFIASIEDTVLSKLEWMKESGSDRQLAQNR